MATTYTLPGTTRMGLSRGTLIQQLPGQLVSVKVAVLPSCFPSGQL
jgi:hypothetical protein